jgi:cytochrome c peroxidase
MKASSAKILIAVASVFWSLTVAAAASDTSTLGLPPLGGPRSSPPSAAKIALGKKIFFDQRLSADGSISCSSCHKPELAFTDGQAVAEGIGHRLGTRNAPTLLNVAYNTTFFWDGRRDSLESQALDPLINPREHGFKSYEPLLALLRSDREYGSAFRSAFSINSGSIGMEHVGQALAAFERTLVAGNSPFDRYQYGGDERALSDSAKHGLSLFQGVARCATCHTIGKQSALFTDNEFHSVNVGLQKIAPRLADLTTKLVAARQSGASLDETVLSQDDLAELGRFAVTLKPTDIGKFRTPGLRNVALTGPYMHDGSVATLRDAVEIELYNRGTDSGRPLILTPIEKSDLVSFLEALTSPDASVHNPVQRELTLTSGRLRESKSVPNPAQSQ